MDSKYVFKELDLEPTLPLNFLRPDKQKKAKAEGYSELRGVYNPVSVVEFIKHSNPVAVLQVASCVRQFYFPLNDLKNKPNNWKV